MGNQLRRVVCTSDGAILAALPKTEHNSFISLLSMMISAKFYKYAKNIEFQGFYSTHQAAQFITDDISAELSVNVLRAQHSFVLGVLKHRRSPAFPSNKISLHKVKDIHSGPPPLYFSEGFKWHNQKNQKDLVLQSNPSMDPVFNIII